MDDKALLDYTCPVLIGRIRTSEAAFSGIIS